jgi:transcriptional regulator with XRE-family HTH domain
MGAIYAARIRAARGYANLTQQQLADALGVDVQTVKRRESPAGSDPKKGERLAIAAACGVPPDFMEGGFPPALSSEAQDRLGLLLQEVQQLRLDLAEAGVAGIASADRRVSGDDAAAMTPERRRDEGRGVARRSADRARTRAAASEPPQSAGSEPRRSQQGAGQPDGPAGRAQRPRSA